MKALLRFAGGLCLLAGTIGIGTGVGISMLGTASAGAITPTTTITVNDTADSAADATQCVPGSELVGCNPRSALAEAQTLAEDVTIVVPAGTYDVDSAHGLLDVNDSTHTVTLQGAGQATTTFQATCTGVSCSITTRVLKVETGTTGDVSGVTIENGNPSGGNGGGILDCGVLMLTDSTVTGNTASQAGGGIELSASGSATLTGDTVSGNTVTTGVTPTNGELEAGGGIAVENPSPTNTENLTVDTTTVTANSGVGNGGGIAAFNTGGLGVVDPNLTVDITNSTISDNHVANNGTSTEVFGAGLAAEDGAWNITGTTVSGNGTSEAGGNVVGGGVDFFEPVASPPSSTFSSDSFTANNVVYEGGGIAFDGGALSVTTSTVNGNDTTEAYAGVLDDAALDGGVFSMDSSTINGNSADGFIGNSGELGNGGGFTSEGCNDVTLTNDTITGNTAGGSTGAGGGYYGFGCGSIAAQPQDRPHGAVQQGHVVPHQPGGPNTTFMFDTIAGNSSIEGGANIDTAVGDLSVLTLGESIVAGATVDGVAGPNCALADATLTSAGYNVIDDSTCGSPGTGDVIGEDPQLGALANNGGPTQTMLPASTSPSVSNVPASVCTGTGVATDQRGEPRGTGTNGACTSGAVEVSVPQPPPPFNPNGYRMVADEGGIFDFGLNFNGSLANNTLNAPIVGLANSPGVNGYVMAGADGGVFALGGANFYGSLGGMAIASPIAAIAAPPDESGYWLVSQSGTIYPFGSAPNLPAVPLPPGGHIVGMASTTDGKGAWLTDQLGDVYAEGTAQYKGGLGGVHINNPIVGIAAAASGPGYVLAASDGGAFAYGTQNFFGSVPGSLGPNVHLVAPIVGIAVTHSGNGYWMVGADGGLFDYGDAPFLGSIYTALPGKTLNGPIVGIQHLGSVPA